MNSDLNSLLLWLSTFWGLLHLLRYHRRRTARSTFLPAPSAAGHSTSPDLFKTRTTHITLHALHLGLASTAWNGAHTRLCTRVRRSSALARVYDVGAVLGVLGMCGAVGLLLWTAVRMVGGVWEGYTVAGDHEQEGQTSGVLHKRDFTEGEESVRSGPGGRAPLQLIVSTSIPKLSSRCRTTTRTSTLGAEQGVPHLLCDLYHLFPCIPRPCASDILAEIPQVNASYSTIT